jgi:hypothetical protein
LGAEFVLVRIDEPIQDNEELVREVSDCKTIGDAFSSGLLIAWPSAFVSYFSFLKYFGIFFVYIPSSTCPILFYRFERRIELELNSLVGSRSK